MSRQRKQSRKQKLGNRIAAGHRRLRMERLEDRLVMDGTIGLMRNDPGAFPGYTLFAPGASTTTYLIDNAGQEVHSWESELPPMSSYLLEDGSLLRVGRMDTGFGAPGASGRVELFNWEGDLRWSYTLNNADYRLHHDIELMPNGNILMIAWERLSPGQAAALGRSPSLPSDHGGELWPDMLIEVKPNYPDPNGPPTTGGEIVWEWRLSDHVTTNPGANPQLVDINYQPSGIGAGGDLADWTHFNSVDYNPQLDQIIVSSREFSEFWIIDHSTTTEGAKGHTGGNSGMGGDLLYRWGNPQTYNKGGAAAQDLFWQHDAHWIEPGLEGAGNILVFNNGWNRQGGASYSSVLEITPPMAQQWFFNNKTTGEIDDLIVFSTKPVRNSWLPITGDWNGDGFDSGGYYNPNTQTWHLNNATDGTDVEVEFDTGPIGADETWLPVVGDWNGDGTDTVGLYDPAANLWYLSNGVDSWADVVTVDTQTPVPAGAIPLAGDWDKQNGDSIGFYDPQTNRWIFINDLDGSIDDSIVFQIPTPHPTWKPIIGDWNKNGKDTAGLYDPIANRWYLNNQTDGGFQDMIVINAPDAPREWLPVIGDWNNNGFDTVGLYNPAYGTYNRAAGAAFGPAAPTWQYTATPRSDFFSAIVSGAQRLPNGNTLINSGTRGRFFEVTERGDVVWNYQNPVAAVPLRQGTEPPAVGIIPGQKATLTFRALRYAPDYPAFEGRELIPQGPIERYPDYFDTVGLYDPNSFDWVLNNHLDGTITDIIEFEAGFAGGVPIAGDWDADGVDTVGLYFPSSQTFVLNNKTDGSEDAITAIEATGVNSTWLPIVGDWDNDGFDTVGLYNPNGSNRWRLSDSTTDWSVDWSIDAPDVPTTYLPIAGNWDGIGGDSVGLYDPARNWWVLNNAIDGSVDPENLAVFDVGAAFPTWIPVTGDWNNNGKDTVGLYDPANRRWYLNNKTNGDTDDLIVFRTPGMPATALPITGDWDGTAGAPIMLGEGEASLASLPLTVIPVLLPVGDSVISPRVSQVRDLPPLIPQVTAGDTRFLSSDRAAHDAAFAQVGDRGVSEVSLGEELIADLMSESLPDEL